MRQQSLHDLARWRVRLEVLGDERTRAVAERGDLKLEPEHSRLPAESKEIG